MKVNQVLQVVALYDIQNLYGERLRTFSNQRVVRQRQEDSVNISKDGMRMLASSRKKKEAVVEIAYSNPRIDNIKANNSFFKPAIA